MYETAGYRLVGEVNAKRQISTFIDVRLSNVTASCRSLLIVIHELSNAVALTTSYIIFILIAYFPGFMKEHVLSGFCTAYLV